MLDFWPNVKSFQNQKAHKAVLISFLSLQPDTSLHSETMDNGYEPITGLVLVLVVPTCSYG